MMTPPLLDLLVSYKDTQITIGSNLVEDAKKLASRHPEFISASYLDVLNPEAVFDLVSKHHLVISFIPPWMHMHVL
jgi:saccharopine dehydrogenase-like NADP-dependent oxidoreductase